MVGMEIVLKFPTPTSRRSWAFVGGVYHPLRSVRRGDGRAAVMPATQVEPVDIVLDVEVNDGVVQMRVGGATWRPAGEDRVVVDAASCTT